jgi:hypothetical protein
MVVAAARTMTAAIAEIIRRFMETSVSPAAALIARDRARACELRHMQEDILMNSTVMKIFAAISAR